MINNQLQPTMISPKALSNQNTIQGVFGQANPNTFTRTVGALPMGPTNPRAQNDVNAIMSQAEQPVQAIQPPYGVQQPITPTYDLNAQ
jgi:hypothetical protein